MPTNHYPNHPLTNQPTRRPRIQPTKNPRLNRIYVRLTDDELTTVTANQQKGGYPSAAAYLRAKGLNDTSPPDIDCERKRLQDLLEMTGVVERIAPAALPEFKQKLRELVKS